MFRTAKMALLGLMFSSAVWADDDWGDRSGNGHSEYPDYREEIIYTPSVVQYAPSTVVQYAAPPVFEYVPVRPRHYALPLPLTISTTTNALPKDY